MQDSTATLKTKHTFTKGLATVLPKELKLTPTQKPAHGCLYKLYSQLPKFGSSKLSSVGEWINSGTSRQWNFIQH